MPVTIIVGGNYGSEGKGRISAYLAETGKFAAAVRCGGPNSGHTFLMHEEGEKDREVKLRQVPCAIANPSMKYYLPAGSLINGRVLNAEMLMYRLMDSLRIDSNAMIIEEKHRQEEQLLNLNKRIGSTCSGTGAAVADRVMRGDDVKLARDIPGLQPFLTNVSNELMKLHERGERILIEGTQGFGLSLYHTPHYPFAIQPLRLA
jgi:adenylosuccinate synthase